MTSAKLTADRTTIMILGGADEMYDWTLATLDKTIVAKWTSIPAQINLRGTDRFMDMTSRLHAEFSTSKEKFVQIQLLKDLNLEDRLKAGLKAV